VVSFFVTKTRWAPVWSLFLLGISAKAQSPPEDPVEMGRSLYYVIEPRTTVYYSADVQRPYLRISFREAVFVLSSDAGWAYIRTQDGAYGYVREETISNVWIRVSKLRKRLF